MQNFLAICLILSLGIVFCNSACICGDEPFCRHPHRCEQFYQCTPEKQYLLKCGPELYVTDTFNCDVKENVQCNSTCGGKDRVGDLYNCGQYIGCLNNRPVGSVGTCNPGNRFDETLGSCVADSNCPEVNNNAQCSDLFKISNTKGKYLQKDGENWIEKTCSGNLLFNMTTCTCQDSYNYTTATVSPCLSITLPLEFNLLPLGSNYYVQGINVNFINNAAYFNGSTRLVIPALANNDLGDYVVMTLNIKPAAVITGIQALVSNNRCSDNGTYNLYLGGSNVYASITLLDNSVETSYQLSSSSVSINKCK
ncbi:3-ketoacyl-CoA thiolase, mitochondrial [Octopus vulgaris]|uniref:3-ketoacyl-CoA thiolase, mitochondrial n=1 Tax=Octopus vulgaris TaxID=6645 RepID=A0AA36BGP6_OCTVU|nr:3-ketoacyl-CoA thiolase, mitochondrial [Octopus vulgaris]